ncbi:MAG: adenylosuccinate lyase [Candidatus Tritonobacter lacicola]|nr:adenylosuccinate lyase [Candidatus Tritonobacter lacicola]
MIERYTRPGMGKLWSDEEKFRRWLRIEILVCEALCAGGEMDRDACGRIKSGAKFDAGRVAEIEAKTRHDVFAFIENVQESIGDDSRYFHRGLTSYDLVDTALSLAMVEAAGLLIEMMEELQDALRRKALAYKSTPQAGRTHGQHAAPVTFGLKLAVHALAVERCVEGLKRARENIRVGKISGAVGTYTNVDPLVEKYVCSRLGLKPARASTQVIGRDRHAAYLSAVAVCASVIENLAVEIRNLQRTEVGEAAEPFSPGQKGSSSMPHKRNPIICERMSGLARIIRGHSAAANENIVLWHERDISHSSAERIAIPDSCILLDYMAAKMTGIIDNLVVDTEKMAANLDMTGGAIFSENLLVELTKRGLSRKRSYDIIQSCAEKARAGGRTFREVVQSDTEVKKHLSNTVIEECFNLEWSLRRVGKIFGRMEWGEK